MQCHDPNPPPYREIRVLKHGSQNLRPSTRFVSYVFVIKIKQSFRRLSVPRIVIFPSAARKPARKNGLEAHDLTVSARGRSAYLKTHLSPNSKKSSVTIKKTNRQREIFYQSCYLMPNSILKVKHTIHYVKKMPSLQSKIVDTYNSNFAVRVCPFTALICLNNT